MTTSPLLALHPFQQHDLVTDQRLLRQVNVIQTRLGIEDMQTARHGLSGGQTLNAVQAAVKQGGAIAFRLTDRPRQ